MQRRAVAALHAMRGPQDLLAIGQRHGLERLRAGMVGGKRNVAGRMPVLGQHHMRKRRREAVDHGHDFIALRHGKRAAGHEVVLHVDDQQAIFGAVLLGHAATPRLVTGLRSMLRTPRSLTAPREHRLGRA